MIYDIYNLIILSPWNLPFILCLSTCQAAVLTAAISKSVSSTFLSICIPWITITHICSEISHKNLTEFLFSIYPDFLNFVSLIISNCTRAWSSLHLEWFCSIECTILFSIKPLSLFYYLCVLNICLINTIAGIVCKTALTHAKYRLNACIFNTFSIRNIIYRIPYIKNVGIIKLNVVYLFIISSIIRLI